MKKLSVLFAFLMMGTIAFSQIYVNGDRIDRKVEQYLMISIEANFGQSVDVRVDYGQERKFAKRYYLTDRKGDKLKFNSFVGAVNYLYKKGWMLFDQYENTGSLTKNATSTSVSYVLVRRAPEQEKELIKGTIPSGSLEEN